MAQAYDVLRVKVPLSLYGVTGTGVGEPYDEASASDFEP